MRANGFFLVALVGLGTALPPTYAFGQDFGDPVDDVKVAVQSRKFQLAHEFRLSLGSMPADPFQKGWTGSFAYTIHWTEYFAWEVFQVTGAFLTSTSLRDELIDTFAIPEEDFAAPRFIATTGVELSPIYGKQAFLNDVVIHQAILVGLYGGMIFGDRQQIGDTLSDFRPAVGIGAGYRFHWTKVTSFRVDIRDFLSFRRAIQNNETVNFDNDILVTVSIGFNLWRDDA